MPTCQSNTTCRTVFQRPGIPWLAPVQISARTIGSLASRQRTKQSVLEIMDTLTDDDYLTYLKEYYARGLEKFGEDWDYADLLTFLHACTHLLQPQNYLEIGVRRGRSMSIVASSSPQCCIIGFDMWVSDYAGMPNPGPDFVRDEMARMGHRGSLELISGDSRQTVQAFFNSNSGLEFDLINVDGDHSEMGARADIEAVLPRLRVGGAILLDDIVHPQHTYLESLWDCMLGSDSHYSCFKFRELGYGVALAVRKS